MEPVFADTLRIVTNMPQEPSIRYRGLLATPLVKQPQNTVFRVINLDCLDACVDLRREFPEACIGLLNMASDKSPGGGVVNGAHAQEEDICRRSTLYPTLIRQRYPLLHDELLFTPNVKIIKNKMYETCQQHVNINGIVSSPAIRRPILNNAGRYSDADLKLMKNKIDMMLETFEYHDIDHLVLGAWGCGAFRNPPEQVAQLFKEALIKRNVSFKVVVFAIMTRNVHEDVNVKAFKEAFGVNYV